jgi:hypothetical protein
MSTSTMQSSAEKPENPRKARVPTAKRSANYCCRATMNPDGYTEASKIVPLTHEATIKFYVDSNIPSDETDYLPLNDLFRKSVFFGIVF